MTIARKMVATHSTAGLVALLEPRLRRAFLEVVARLKSKTTLKALEALVVEGRTEALAMALASEAAILGDAAALGYATSARSAAKVIGVSFDGVNARAVAEMSRQRNRVIREMGQDQIRVVRQVVTRGVEQGLNPRVVARELKDTIGLTAKQDAAVENFRRLLREGSREALERQLRDRRFDAKVMRAVRGERPLTNAEIDRMVQRYRERYLKYRAEVIARTEGLEAANGGAREMWRQAAESGAVERQRILRRWVTSGRTNRRHSHRAMHGQERGLDEPFVSGNGYRLNFPGDPDAPLSETASCACGVTTRILAPGETVADRLAPAA